MRRALALAPIVALTASSCARAEHRSATRTTSAPAVVARDAPSDAALSPLRAPAPFLVLPAGDLPPPVVSLPLGTTTPRPVAIATQGIFDKPQWQCDVWRDLLGDRAWVVCPRGELHPASPSKEDDRYRYRSAASLAREIDVDVAALRARFGERVAPGPLLYAGFSQGAYMGAHIVAGRPDLYPRAVFIEGGFFWSDALARAFAGGARPGERRVLFACGSPGCVASARQAARALERAGAEARVVAGEWEGHSYFGKTREAVRGALGWILEGTSFAAAGDPPR